MNCTQYAYKHLSRSYVIRIYLVQTESVMDVHMKLCNRAT
jgi:hypothetical protein